MTATGDTNKVQQQGVQAAKWMQSLGINTDLAPVVDVGPVSNLLQDRQFSDNPKTVSTYAGAFLNGSTKFRDNWVSQALSWTRFSFKAV